MTLRSDAEFAHFFATVLHRELRELEKTRLRLMKKVRVLIGVCLGVIGLAAMVGKAYDILAGSLIVSGVAVGGIGCFFYKFLISEYVHQFKIRVIDKIVKFIDPGLTYWPNGHISAVRFNSSRIFERYPDRMRGDDLVEGKIGETKVAFSEVHAEHKTETVDRYGNRRRRYSTIFKGLFFIAGFNKRFYGKVVVLPDTAEHLLGDLGSLLQSVNTSRGQFVKMDDPEFEKYFVVYADDQIEARYVLSPSLMKRIVEFRKKTGKRVYLSFVGSEVFVAIPYRRSLFEPPVFSKVTSFKNAQHYYEDLKLAIGIVDDLNLNTRIWTRLPSEVIPHEHGKGYHRAYGLYPGPSM